MNKILILILGALAASYLWWRSRPKGGQLTFQKFNSCPISYDPRKLVACDDDENKCSSCSQDPRVCVSVTPDNPYTLDPNDGSLPFDLPTGKWCLPPKATDLPCNRLAGDPVLSKLGKGYVWRCRCKYPNLVRNAGPFGDCSEVVACDKLQNPTNNLVCPPKSEFCQPGEEWNGTWDPTAGVCACAANKRYIQQGSEKLCVTDTCFPGQTDPTLGTCNCPEKGQTEDGSWSSYIVHNNRCITDPCNPHGYFDGVKCVCNEHSIPYQDSQSPTTWVCKSPCSGQNNPCGNRGTCVFDKTGKTSCTNCKYPNYQSDDGMCGNFKKSEYSVCTSSDQCETNFCTRGCATEVESIWKWATGTNKYCCLRGGVYG